MSGSSNRDVSATGRGRVVVGITALLAVGFGALSVPPRASEPLATGEPTPFRWDADSLFAAMEADFAEARALPREEASALAATARDRGATLLAEIQGTAGTPTGALLRLAEAQFRHAVLGAAHEDLLDEAQDFVLGNRVAVMRAAAAWPGDRATHEALYRVVFGGRIAIEEALIQSPRADVGALVQVESIPSGTPSIEVAGVRVHSGDILLSRGGAPTSALIARGSDFANTFSHAALAHVDPATGEGTVVESLIETGSVLSTVEEYLESKKHRILVLRLRPDHPALSDDPMLPHRAATRMLERLRARPVPYDFAMRWSDPGSMFCSEVIHHAFVEEGVALWPIRSAMTAPGLVRWLSQMGVREFRTLVPSDLEYDTQLRAVAAWRDLSALMDYRLDNAITDVLLEEADAGRDLGYPWYALPAARLLRASAPLQRLVGRQPSIPRGMTADAALRVNALVGTVNPSIKADLVEREARFVRENGFRAPYWTLVRLARESLRAVEDSLGSGLTDRVTR